MDKQLEQKLKAKRADIMQYIKHDTPLKSNEHRLDRFMLKRWLIPYQKELAKKQRTGSTVPITPLPTHSAIEWVNQGLTDMKWPLLHVYGGTGTGKSHFCRGFIRYILLNRFDFDQMFPTSIEYFDWHNYLQSVKNSFNTNSQPRELNWQAEIMLIEDIDRQACVSRDGGTFSLELFLAPLKERLEIDRLPTIFISYRNTKELTKFLTTDISGKTHETAKQMAQDIGNLIGNTLYVGQSRGTDFRAEITANKSYYDKEIVSKLKTQKTSEILGLTANYGMDVEW